MQLKRICCMLCCIASISTPAAAARFGLGGSGLRSGPTAKIQRFIQNGQLDRAESELQRLIKGKKCAGEEQALLARVYVLKEQLPKALTVYQAAHLCGYEKRAFILEMATAFGIAGQHAKAVALYRSWLVKQPKDAEFLQELGITLLSQGQLSEAVTALQKAHQLAPFKDLQRSTDYGVALLYSGQHQAAADIFNKVLQHKADFVPALIFLGDVRSLQKQLPAAQQAYQQAVQADPHNARAALRLARVLYQLQQGAQALSIYEGVLKKHPRAKRALYGKVQCLLLLQKFPQARSELQALSGVLSRGMVLLLEGELLRRQGNYPQAKQALLEVVQLGPDTIDGWRELYLVGKAQRDKALIKRATDQLTRLKADLPE